ncbi:hypothetical protein [Cohnella terricola]|uniref:Uncharacterized protein n=1 Tax=Cohnella terricola TaxID=1289167 RepID=A0A559JSV1_9BACL|nr:hypothetical protein [Cohnella terricola]TVY02963.1 hypothetical protein FPZ45_03465 [Cohnella terricola]
MRDTGVETNPSALPDTYRERPRRKRRGPALFFAILWLVLIAGGVYGAKWYSDRIQQQVSSDLERQTAGQIALMQQDFDARITKMETDYQVQLAQMESKIQALNELLTFAKDNADTKTDNSNKLYTQLAEVKKQLSELKKSLDVLK